MSTSETLTGIDGAKAEAVEFAARRVHKRYRSHVDLEDLLQEGRAWVHQHPLRVDAFFRDVIDERTLTGALRRFGKQVERVMEKIAREEKAVRSGYRPEDEFFYGMSLLETVLPALYNPELMASPPVGEKQEGSSNADPAESGNWLAHCLDIKRAFVSANLTAQESTCLYLRYGVGLGVERAAQVMEMGRHPYQDMLAGALRRLSWELHGRVPDRGCPTECEHTSH